MGIEEAWCEFAVQFHSNMLNCFVQGSHESVVDKLAACTFESSYEFLC